MKNCLLLLLFGSLLFGCREAEKSGNPDSRQVGRTWTPKYARGFRADHAAGGVVYLTVTSPWPDAGRAFRYALVPREELADFTPARDDLDGVVGIPVERIIVTSTTHIPTLETLGMESRLVGFPGLDYISSPLTRKRIEAGKVRELGSNDQLNTERVLSLEPDLVVGFGVSGTPGSYQVLEASGIPVVYNGDWMEENPLGKAEWIVFFGLLFGEEQAAKAAFQKVEKAYLEAREIAAAAPESPTVMSGALYRDVWYLPGGDSWAARFIRDANARYLWADAPGGGSLSLSLEAVLEKGTEADFWIAPSQYTSYSEMGDANTHYQQFRAYREQRIYTYALTQGPTGGLWYFERGPGRPDLILKDLIHWFHPGLLADYTPEFFKPLNP